MRIPYVAFLFVLCALAGMAAGQTTKATQARKVTSSKKSTRASVKTTVKKATAKLAKGKKAPAATWRTRQQNPTPERYKEIQQALADKGYLKGEPSGVWDAGSVDAMQRFQADQKITPTGKINAPSLIGLGLGAKSAGAPEAAPLPQTPAPAATPATPTPPPQ